MKCLRNGEKIGYSNYYFEHNEDIMTVENNTKFVVEILGLKVFSIDSKSKEIYQKDKLISSYVGKANADNIIGNWWNSKILGTKTQISPLSGSIKEQEVNFISKETLSLLGKTIEVDHFKLKSTDDSLEEDKKLDFDIWYDSKNYVIVKVEYNRLGKWQYILKKIE